MHYGRQRLKYLMTMLLVVCGSMAHAQDSTNRVELEAGVVATRNMEIRGFEQSSATRDWSKTAPTVRLEDWWGGESAWNFGVVFQPLSLSYRDTFRHDLTVKGRAFQSGDAASLDYQFPTLRVSANKPLFQGDDGSYVRLGGSAVLRYAKVGLTGSGQSFNDTNFIVVPLLNVEASRPLGHGYRLFTRSDFLPGIGGGSVFLDGLYDVYLGVSKNVGPKQDLDVGVRLFFGGYDPKKADDYANRIFFNSLVVRYRF